MTAPRQILPGATYLVTRRCARREFLLRPSAATNAIFLYVLALAATRYGVRVHAYCVLSNHFHLVVTDPDARLPEFEQYLDSLVARAVNASLGRWESFWAPSSYSAVKLETPDDVVAKCAYVLANPVAAGLVGRGSEWPGLWSGPERVGGPPVVAARPTTFFRANGPMPQIAELELTAPAGFHSVHDFRERVATALAIAEEDARTRIIGAGGRFLGARKVLAQDPLARPPSTEPRRETNPRVAARDGWKRVEALSRMLDFVAAYREARMAFCNGVRDVVFPAGTYLLRVAQNVRCVECAYG